MTSYRPLARSATCAVAGSSITVPASTSGGSRTKAGSTGRAGLNAGSAACSASRSSRIPTKVPKCDVIQSPRAPSPCSTIVSIAWRAEARSVTAISSGHSKMPVTAWARAGPMNTASSPYRAHRAARPASIPRYRWPTVCHCSGTATSPAPAAVSGWACRAAANPAASSSAIPSGRSR